MEILVKLAVKFFGFFERHAVLYWANSFTLENSPLSIFNKLS